MLSLQIRSVTEEVTRVCAQGTLLLGPDTGKLSTCIGGFRGKYRKVQLDIAGITRMDAAGLGALAEAYSKCDARGTKIKLYDVSPTVLELLQLAKLLAVFGVPIVNSVRSENMEVTGEWCEARLGIHRASISGRMKSRSDIRGPAGLKRTVDDFVAVQSTLKPQVSTSFNTDTASR